MPKWKPNPMSETLPTSKVHSILVRLLHQRQGLIVFLWLNWLINPSYWKQLSGQNVICILRDNTNVFILLAYWVNRAELQCKVQMERWDVSVLDINTICANHGQKCLQLLCMHVLSGCDTTSYPYGNGNVTALNTMVSRIYQCVAIIGDIDTTHTELMKTARPSFVSL